MSVLPKDTIRVLAQMKGIDNLNDDITTSLAPDVEYRIREVVQVRVTFERASLVTDFI